MACLKTSLICLALMASVQSSQAQHDLSGQANISVAEAIAGAANAKHWMQMQNSGRASGSGCRNDNCVESCEEDWEENGEHCYLWSTDKKNWTDAEDFCRKEGGHLASVHSTATNDFVLEGMKNRAGLDRNGKDKEVWLGGNDIEVEGTWKWTDCSPWNVTFWGRGEPNNVDGGENCLHYVSTYGWNDVPCIYEQGFLCSKSICSGDSEHSVSEPTESAVTGEGRESESAVTGTSVSEPPVSGVKGGSLMWKPATISLAVTLLLLLVFF